ncbi:MAG TPA: hypothetical protein VK149_03505 [Sideroxyarcus sp.]|nr:hypothetical protein [Sideroxyarcus sp.]
MTVKLLLNPAAESKAFTHAETGVVFKIRPIDPKKYGELRKASRNASGDIDAAKQGEIFAVAAIEDWEGIGDSNGPVECNDANKKTFGRNQALNIMHWIIDQACGLDQYRIEEEQSAKNG